MSQTTSDTTVTTDDSKLVTTPCHLWSQNRCPYGNTCKFSHDGPGGCTEPKHGEDDATPSLIIPKSEKDCTAWKSKGKCNKKEKGKCPYRHDETVRQAALERKRQKMMEYQKNSAHQSKQQQQQSNQKQSKRLKPSLANKHPLGIILANGQEEPRILSTCGLRHVEPYFITASLTLEKHVGKTIQQALDVLCASTKSKPKRPPLEFWQHELVKGTLTLLENNNNHNGYKIVATPDHVIEKSNVLRGRFHFHEESIRNVLPTIIYQDDEYLIVNKPAGVDVLTNPNAGRVFNSLPGLLYTEFGIQTCYPAHRIDNSVSGLVCCGKTTTAQKRLTHRIKFGEAQKTYLTRVRLPMSESRTALEQKLPMVIDAPLGFDTASCLAVVVDQDDKMDGDPGGKACKTTIVKCLGGSRSNGTAILQIQPNTGRKHQLRKHLQHVGLCIANDERYGGDEKVDRISAFWGSDEASAATKESQPSHLPLQEVLSASFTGSCQFCTFAKSLFASGGVGENKIRGPCVGSGIWLHSWRYEFPTLDLAFETPIPEWAQEGAGEQT